MTAEGILRSAKAGERFPVPLKWLLELDNCSSAIGLADAFGDRYLCYNNPIYASLREAALQFGYGFSSADGPLWRDYQAFGLMQLPRIISTKTIPYLDTSNAVARLADENPGGKLPASFILRSVRKNYTLHEAAHCVAHAALSRSALEMLVPSVRNRFVVEAVIAEAYANTVEKLGALIQRKPLSDALFYSLNSYISASPKFAEDLLAGERALGRKSRFALLFLAHFEANLTTPDSDSEGLARRIETASDDLPSPDANSASSARNGVIRAGFQLSMEFRENTTPSWFEFLGYGGEYRALAREGWLTNSENQEFVRELSTRLWDIAGRP